MTGGPLAAHWNVSRTPSVKLDVAKKIAWSRCQAWKHQLSPAAAETAPVGWGTAVRSMVRENSPAAPLFRIWPGPT